MSETAYSLWQQRLEKDGLTSVTLTTPQQVLEFSDLTVLAGDIELSNHVFRHEEAPKEIAPAFISLGRGIYSVHHFHKDASSFFGEHGGYCGGDWIEHLNRWRVVEGPFSPRVSEAIAAFRNREGNQDSAKFYLARLDAFNQDQGTRITFKSLDSGKKPEEGFELIAGPPVSFQMRAEGPPLPVVHAMSSQVARDLYLAAGARGILNISYRPPLSQS